MYFIRKLRPPKLTTESIIGISLFPILVFFFVFLGIRAAFVFIAFVELISMTLQVILYMRTRNIHFLWLAMALSMILIFALYVAFYGLDDARKVSGPLAMLVIIAAVIALSIVIRKKIKWRTREILELAAMPVSQVDDGFTGRPIPAGIIEATALEVEAFTAFMRENLIAIPYTEGDVVVYSFTSNIWKQIVLKSRYEDETWVSIDPDGRVSASISKKDYLLYKHRFSFDQLCASLGKLIAEFFELFKHGEGKKIIERFDNLGLNPFTE